MGIDIETILGYQRYLPDLHQIGDGSWQGSPCPRCDGLVEIVLNHETGLLTDWLCKSCGWEGTLEDLENLVSRRAGQDVAQPADVGGEPEFEEPVSGDDEMSQFGMKNQLVEEENGGFERDSFSPRRILLDLAKGNYPSLVYRLAIALVFSGEGLTGKELSALTNIRLTSAYRALEGNPVFQSEGNPARYYMNLYDSPRGESTIKGDSPGGESELEGILPEENSGEEQQ